MKLNPTFFEIVLALLISLTIYVWVKHGKHIRRWWKELHKRHRRPRQPRPREPGDCPLCARGIHYLPKQPRRGVTPWSQIRSPRGRKKTVDTTGYACLNPNCAYFGIADSSIHALVSNGNRAGKHLSGTRVFARLFQRRFEPVFLCHHRPFWLLG